MIKIIIGVLIFFLLTVLSISAYLTPDDLVRCGDSPSNLAGCEKVDAVVAVSGGNTPVRAAEAIRLYKAGWSKYLIFSGAAFDDASPSNASVMKEQAIQAGIPASRILTEDISRTTHQNAEKTDKLLVQYGISRLIVVTSPYHQRRAGLEFKQNAGEDVLVLNRPAWSDPDWQWYWWATPRGWWLAMGELVKVGATHAGESQ